MIALVRRTVNDLWSFHVHPIIDSTLHPILDLITIQL